LLMYLNTVNFGAGAYGAEVAAQRYFSKPASDLTLTEAALLAGIPQSPTYNDPLQYPEHALQRRNRVLERMLGENYITQSEYAAAIAAPLGLNPKDVSDDGIIAYPYFTSYVRYLLYNDYDLSESDILKGGLKVYTTLDVGKQLDAEAACAKKRESMYNDAMEVAMAVVDPDSGNVQAIVGGSDYSVSEVNLATGQGGGGRPCGSVFKTFTLVECIKKAISPTATYVDCSSPATVDGYTLENYANTQYGTRSISGAFAVSSNTGFVRLISAVGVKDVANTAHELGVTSDLHEDEAGATLTLGVQNVTPLELANAVATIANGGTRHDLCAVTTIEDRDGKVIVDDSDPSKRSERVLTPEQAHAVQEVMRGVVTSGTGTAASMYNGQQVAGKTGTSEDYKDISFVGYTPFIAASIWVGDPTNVSAVPTGSAADVFRNYATAVMEREDLPVKNFPEASNPEYKPFESSQYHVSSGYSYYYNSYESYDNSYNDDSANQSSGQSGNADAGQSEQKEEKNKQSDDSGGTKKNSGDSGSGTKKKNSG
ncbi:MAG: penicillin-binding protein, partial [Eggerthellaceae bacterium]|nr:penicillin-binding protein [Eggerthellaceae bacterium]